MRSLLAQCGNPQERLRIIHVAGSKGKGSTSAMLATILRRAGYRTGLFTSPHLSRVEERIQVDDCPISGCELAALLNHIHDVVHKKADLRSEHGSPLTTHHSLAAHPTFFEVATALGFLHFVRRRVDTAIVEVGLGGRFDSTNVCRPAVSVITSISFDHTQQLGNRLASIAMEKAGIVKPGGPVVSGVVVPEALHVIEEICRERRAPLRQLGPDFWYRYEPGRIDLGKSDGQVNDRPSRVQIITRRGAWPWMKLGLLGEHQAANAAVAVAVVEELRDQGWYISESAVAEGLAQVRWPARLEVMGRRPLVLLDCAHNVASARALVETVQHSIALDPSARRYLVFACSNDKDLAGIFEALAPHFHHFCLTRYAQSPRSVPPEQLADALRSVSGVSLSVHANAADALDAARSQACPDDLICVTGSVFLAGELRPLLLSAGQRD